MKRITYVFLLLLITLLAACSSNEQSNNASEGNESQEAENEVKDGGINVDKGLLNVELTLPASLFEGEDIDTVIANAEEKGINKVTKNEDGSLTYKMSKAQHKELMFELEKSITESIEEMKNDENLASIKDISYNKSFSDFTLVVDKNAFENSFDGFAILGLGLSGSMYQLYNGANPDNYNVTITVKDEVTQEVISEIVYPRDLEDIEE